MMYSEFIEHSNFTEQYISYAEYTTFIEPIYMAADQIPTKQEFIAMLRDAFKSLVNPVVEKAMHSLSLEDNIYMHQMNDKIGNKFMWRFVKRYLDKQMTELYSRA